MAEFPRSQQAQRRLYKHLSNPVHRIILLACTLFTIILFGIELALYAKYLSGVRVYNDLGYNGSDFEWMAFAILFAFTFWDVFLLIWHYALHRKPIHPGYYIGVELYVSLSLLVGLVMVLQFSNFASSDDGFKAQAHYRGVRGLALTAYGFGFCVSAVHFVYFVMACHSCRLYDAEKKRAKIDGNSYQC